MKKVFLVLVSLLLVTQVACGSRSSQSGGQEQSGTQGSGAAKKISWKMGHIVVEDHIWHKTAVKFAELVAEKTDGQIEITVFPNSQLAEEVGELHLLHERKADLITSGKSMSN